MFIEKQSVQSLLIRMRFNGQDLATGTGFLVKTEHGFALVTNRHNVTGRDQETNSPLSKTGGVPNEIVIRHNKRAALGEWIEVVEPIFDRDKPLWVEHPELGARADVVCLPLKDTAEVECYCYTIDDSGPRISLTPTSLVSVIGFPFGLSASKCMAIWATGFIASEPELDYDNRPVFLIDCRTRQGQSGSPVVAYRQAGAYNSSDGALVATNRSACKFLGVYSGRIRADSDIGMVWKAEIIRDIVIQIEK